MRFEIEGPTILGEGDELEIGDAIRLGDIVWFDRVGSQLVVLRLVSTSISEPCFRVERGDQPEVVRLVVQEPRATTDSL